jgi:predicted esterase
MKAWLTGRLPVVIQLHGTGGNKEQLLPRLAPANRGFVAIAIDGGPRRACSNAPGLATPYTTAIFNAHKDRARASVLLRHRARRHASRRLFG